MSSNKLIIAAAGSGKTSILIKEALKTDVKQILITTYTQANEAEIRKNILKINKFIPHNITVKTWFSLLLQHGVRPYQGCVYDEKINGLILVNSPSGIKYHNGRNPVYFCEETDFAKHYFNKDKKIFSDKLSKFVFRCNEKTGGEIISRLSRIFTHIFIDEVQDLAGYDLELLKLLFKSNSSILLIGDPRQVVYLTHNEKKYSKYTPGKIKDFITNECKGLNCDIDDNSLNLSYRNNQKICDFSAKLYTEFNPIKSNQNVTTEHDGVFLVKKKDVDNYLEKFKPMQLRDDRTVPINENFRVMNFGESKGLTFDRVLIYPTKPFIKWLIDNQSEFAPMSRSKFYVAITRARYSVGIVFDYDDSTNIKGIEQYKE
jgi:DNA helicase II / ATP-dependent DNA helicase PcrA